MLRLIKRNYFLLISVFLIFYFGFNLVSGERGLFSYIEKKELLSNLKKEELILTNKIEDMDHKNSLLSTNLDLDYIETLISCLLYTSPSPRDLSTSRMPSSA